VRSADTYSGRACNCFEAVIEDGAAELSAQVDAVTTDELFDLQWHAERLAKVARAEWLNRVRRPAGES
jgi:hypothetical protein